MDIAEQQEALRRRRFTVEEYHKMGEAGILGEDDRVESATVPGLAFDADEVLPPREPEARG